TVPTDYASADRLYFEPLTFEDVLEVVHAEQQSGEVAGVICTLGGQTPLGLAQRLKDAGVTVLGTQPEAIDLAEHRGAFGRVLREAGLPAPKHGTATSFAEAKAVADGLGYPVLVRPSHVLGGRDRGGRARSAERPVRTGRRRALRPGGEPACEPHRAVRVEGDRGAARQGGGSHRARGHDRGPETGGVAATTRRRRRPARRRADR